MTTFQDPPPHSRRAVRASERGEGSVPTPAHGTPYSFDAAADPQQAPQTPTPPLQTGRRAQLPEQHANHSSEDGFEPLNYSTQGRVSPPVDEQSHEQPLASAPAPGNSETSSFRVRDFSPEGGRRSAGSHQQTSNPVSVPGTFPTSRPVDLDYHTQAAPPPPPAHSAAPVSTVDDAMNHTLTRRELREMRAAEERKAPALQMPEPIDSLLNSGPIEIPTLAPPPGQSQALAEAMAEFDLLTRARREAEARARDAQVASLVTPINQSQPQASVPIPMMPASAPVASAPVASVPSVPEPVAPVVEDDHDTDVVDSDVVDTDVVDADVVDADVVEADAVEPDFDDTDAIEAEIVENEPVSAVPATDSFAALFSAPEKPAAESAPFPTALVSSVPLNSVPVNSVPISSVPIDSTPLDSIPLDSTPLDSTPLDSTPVASAPEQSALVDPVFTEPVFEAPTAANAPAVASNHDVERQQPQPSAPELDPEAYGARSPRASNHWRVQAAIEDQDLPFENTLSRTVGSNTSAITTSALVLPSVPQPDSMLASLNATGEILVTGSINLPRSLGSTGAHPDRVDHADDEDDPLDSQVAAPDSAPVRAIRAVSTAASTRGVIETKRPQGNRALTVVIGVASVLCVGLVGLLVFAFATGKL